MQFINIDLKSMSNLVGNFLCIRSSLLDFTSSSTHHFLLFMPYTEVNETDTSGLYFLVCLMPNLAQKMFTSTINVTYHHMPISSAMERIL